MMRPGTAMLGIARPGTPAAADMEMMRPGTSTGMRPGTSTGMRPGTAAGSYANQSPAGAVSSSDLTFGSATALCGNVARALRNRKRDVASTEEVGTDGVGGASMDEVHHEDILHALGNRPGTAGDRQIWDANSTRADKASPKKEVNIMVITHDDAPSSPVDGDGGSAPVSPMYDEDHDLEGATGADPADLLESWDDD